MFNLEIFLPFLSGTQAKDNMGGLKDPWAILGFVFAFMGVYLFLSAFLPQYKFIYRTKSTSGIDIKMFTFHAVNTFFFTVASIAFTILGIALKNYVLMGNGLLFVTLNLIGFCGNSYMVGLKMINQKKARALNMSECDYCNTLAKR